jgi:large subunit ribosomal protein L23
MKKTIIIKKPIITESSLRDASRGFYTFEVEREANKFQIKRAIEEMFKVHVTKMATIITKGKRRLVGKKRQEIHEGDRKKAKVRLAKDEKIKLFEVAQT